MSKPVSQPPFATTKVAGAARRLLESLFLDAVAAASAPNVMPANFRRPRFGRLAVVAAGKAAGAMMEVFLDRVDGVVEGVVATPSGHEARRPLPAGVELFLAGHPVPDAQSVLAAKGALDLAASLGARDHLVVLLSGGGSALLAAPKDGLTLNDKIEVNRALLRSGAPIAEMNVVRRRLSKIKGGGLARAASPALVTTLAISDIPGDDLALIASGPTVDAKDDPGAAAKIIDHYGLVVSPRVKAILSNDRKEPLPPPNDGNSIRLLASARKALDAAGARARAAGCVVEDLGDRLEDEARVLGAAHARLALRRQDEAGPPRVILSGGETRVFVRNPEGRGGRNLEYLLALAIGLKSAPTIFALACDTDGVDGTDRAAGALIDPDTLQRAKALGVDAASHLESNNAYLFFEALGDLVTTGPTRTNVNDFRAIFIGPKAAPT